MTNRKQEGKWFFSRDEKTTKTLRRESPIKEIAVFILNKYNSTLKTTTGTNLRLQHNLT